MLATTTKIKLLEAASRVFLEHGFDAASMDLVRIDAGVSNGSLYHHFPTKAHLAGALYEHTLRDFHTAISKPISASASAKAGVQGLVRAYIRWVLAHPDRARLLHELRRAGDLTELESGWASANKEVFEKLKAWVDEKADLNEIRRMPFPVWMALVFAPARALTPQWVKQPQPSVPSNIRDALEHGAWHAVAA